MFQVKAVLSGMMMTPSEPEEAGVLASMDFTTQTYELDGVSVAIGDLFDTYPATIDSNGALLAAGEWFDMSAALVAVFNDRWGTGFTVFFEWYQPADTDLIWNALTFTDNISYYVTWVDEDYDAVYTDHDGFGSDYYTETDQGVGLTYSGLNSVALTAGRFEGVDYVSGITHNGNAIGSFGSDTDAASLADHASNIYPLMRGHMFGWQEGTDIDCPTGTLLKRVVIFTPQPLADLPSISSTGTLP
jgi:hypothetical protein